MTTYLIGLDGGGTKTTAVVIDQNRRELGRGSGGPGNYHSAGAADALAGLPEAIGKALERADGVSVKIRGQVKYSPLPPLLTFVLFSGTLKYRHIALVSNAVGPNERGL